MPESKPISGEKWELAPCASGGTLRERASGQLMHSRIGPWAEANAVYVAQSELTGPVLERDSQQGAVVLYDVGMGIAANALAAIAAHSRGTLKIYSFENQPDALALALGKPESFAFHDPYREILHELLRKGEWCSPSVEWRLIRGDFRAADLTNLPQANLVYFDFYAPQTCPELWTPEVFLKLRARMADRGRLITYSTAKSVRAAMLVADFFVGEGAPTEMKSATTVASPSRAGAGALLGEEWLAGLTRATRPLPEGWQDLRKHPQFSLCF